MKKIFIAITFLGLGYSGLSAALPQYQGSQIIASASSSSSSDVDKLLDSYDKYVDKYIKLLKKAQAGDPTAIIEYAKVLKQAQDLEKKLNKCEGEMDSAQIERYSKITAKLTKALN